MEQINITIESIKDANGVEKHYAFKDQECELNYYIAWCLLNKGVFTFANGETLLASECEELASEIEAKEKEEEERVMRECEEWKEHAREVLEETEKDIENAIAKLSEESTLKDIAHIDYNMGFYSDYYKDLNGIRPRWCFGEWYGVMEEKAPMLMKRWKALDWEAQLELIRN